MARSMMPNAKRWTRSANVACVKEAEAVAVAAADLGEEAALVGAEEDLAVAVAAKAAGLVE